MPSATAAPLLRRIRRTRVEVAGADLDRCTALVERLLPALLASGADIWVLADANGSGVARLRSSGLITPARVVGALPPHLPERNRVVVAIVPAVGGAADVALHVVSAQEASTEAPIAAPANVANVLVVVAGRRAPARPTSAPAAWHGSATISADLDSGVGVERVLAVIGLARRRFTHGASHGATATKESR